MRIKLGLLDANTEYLRRMSDSLLKKYSDNLSIFLFTSFEAALNGISDNDIDVLAASQEFDGRLSSENLSCAVAYFCDSADVREIYNKPTIFRYQKIDEFYRRILDIYADNCRRPVLPTGEGKGNIVIFSSPCGGTGTSCAAAAFAVAAAPNVEKVLYINLEKFGDSGVFFDSMSRSGLSDIVYAVKLGKSNLRLKFESVRQTDGSGVGFFPSPESALDISELSYEEMVYLISELRASGVADLIVLDLDFAMNDEAMKVFREANAIVWVSDGTETANSKVIRAYTALRITEKQKGGSVLSKTYLMYNKFSNKMCKTVLNDSIVCLGGAPRIERATTREVVHRLQTEPEAKSAFNKLIEITEG